MRRLNRLTLSEGAPGQVHWSRIELLVDARPLQAHIESSTSVKVEEVSPLGWTDPEFERAYLRRLLLREASSLPSGRHVLLVCPLCADVGCRCVSAVITAHDGRVVWSDLGFETDYDPGSLTLFEHMSFVFDLGEYHSVLSRFRAL